MSAESLAASLLKLPAVQSRLAHLEADSIVAQFANLVPVETLQNLKHDWHHLLTCASVFAQTENPTCENAALRIAQHCLLSNPESAYADASCVILDVLTNKPSVSLAESRGLVEESLFSRLPFPLASDWIRRDVSQAVLLGDGSEISLNRFQRTLWDAVSDAQYVSVSAPTSAGKSFALCSRITEFIRENPTANIVYLVPTRALIQQVDLDLQDWFVKRQLDLKQINLTSVPEPPPAESTGANVWVLTQERLQILLNDAPFEAKLSLLIVDEAQKLSDGSRGILLGHVVSQSINRFPAMDVCFASPFVSNPEILLKQNQQGKTKTVQSDHVTVNQNLLWVSQVKGKPKKWLVESVSGETLVELGHVELEYSPAQVSKRLTFVAHAMGDVKGGNIVYVNGAADAEKAAIQLAELEKNSEANEERKSLIELVKKVIHPKYQLAKVLKNGVGFHYGNMPHIVRSEIERLFKEGHIRFLVCTSTLIEGMNLPSKSIFVRGPQKGKGKPMSETDFWNLAGRAGRLGKEFQGNVVCIDPRKEGVWKEPPPKERKSYAVVPTSDLVLSKFDQFQKYLTTGELSDNEDLKEEFDHLVSHLISEHSEFGQISDTGVSSTLTEVEREQLSSNINSLVDSFKLPLEIAKRNPGISLPAMEKLLKYFEERDKSLDDLMPFPPESDGAVDSYSAIFTRINSHLEEVFGNQKRVVGLSILTVNWMRGYPVSRLISNRIQYNKRTGQADGLPAIIRNVMRDVEKHARFIAPKYLSCYIDVLRFHLNNIDREDLVDQLSDVKLWLEFGTCQRTQLSLIELGLSRTSAIIISELIVEENLTRTAALQRLTEFDLSSIDVPHAVEIEIQKLLVSEAVG
jgi:hypothetical protein